MLAAVGAALVRFAYSLLLRVATPVYFARLWWRGRREPLYRRRWGERLGFGGDGVTGRVCVHSVSLGETRASEPLLLALRRHPRKPALLLTHGTGTGRDAGARLLERGDRQAWLPYDTPGAVRRFLKRHRPAAIVLMETEVWPNLIAIATKAGVPVILANARLSQRSFDKGRRLRWLMRPAAQALQRVLAQTVEDAERLRAIGAHDVLVAGNLKFDVAPNPKLIARGLEWRQGLARDVVVAASTREGEEEPLLEAWASLPQPRPLLVIVPRHPQRFDGVGALVPTFGLTLARRSYWAEHAPAAAGRADVWLGDSVGEMPLYYGMADTAILGGSFAPLGGHNLIEAAACGCPLIMGPHTFNFAQASRKSLAAKASMRVETMAEAVRRAVALAADPQRNQWVQRAFDFAAQHRGAAERMAREIMTLARH